MRNSRLDRILYIQQVLVQGGVLNKQQTADCFGVSEKTIQRDLDTLRNHFADSEPRREILYNSAKGGYLLDDTLSRFLTSSEILAVCKILLESRSMVKEEMFPILDKLILACTPLDRLNQVKDLISNERFHYVEPQHGRKFIESLWEIGNFFFGLLKGQFDLLFCQDHQIFIDAFQDEIHIRPCHGNAAGQGFFVGLSVDVVLFQKHQPDALVVEVFVQSKTFFCISGHPGH